MLIIYITEQIKHPVCKKSLGTTAEALIIAAIT